MSLPVRLKLNKPWSRKAFELLFHAESHKRSGADYDKRLAYISFDNAIEVAIATYINLNPLQRNGQQFENKSVNFWNENYINKLTFFEEEVKRRAIPEIYSKGQIHWFHEQRNSFYHDGAPTVPSIDDLNEVGEISFWVFSVLFEEPAIKELVGTRLAESSNLEPTISNQFAEDAEINLSSIFGDPKKIQTLAIASLIGKWDEANPADMAILKRLTSGF